MFKEAIKKGYRYPTNKGNVTTEDLYQMPLKQMNKYDLNTVAQTLHSQIEKTETLDFVSSVPKSNALLDAKMEIVKSIIADKVADKANAKNASAIKERREYLLSLKAGKAAEKDLAMSETAIDKELAALDS